MKRLLITAFILITIVIASCYNDSSEALFPAEYAICDTSNVTFSLTITSIMSDYCWNCHSNSNALSKGSNIKLETYDDIIANIGAIIPAINHTGTGHPMPHDEQRLRQCLLTQFDVWVKEGTPKN